MRGVILLALVCLLGKAFSTPLPEVPATCERYTACNGQMCDEICKIGTVEIDPWVKSTLAFQRGLQKNVTLLLNEMIGTHNGAIVQDYGMGIEEKFLKNLLLPIWGERFSEVVIANQRHSIYDQLEMGARHIEVDIYHYARLGGIRICHWPVFPPDFVFIVNQAAKEQDMYPLDWDVSNLGCDTNKPFLEEKLLEMRSWMDKPENQEEVIGIYIDNKNVRADHIDEFTTLVLSIFGDILFTAEQKNTEYPNSWPSPAELVGKNRRVWIENNDDSWIGDEVADKYFFTPPPWPHQFGPERFSPFPNCTIDGNDYVGKDLTRSLDGSLVLGPAFLWEGRSDYPPTTIQGMSECTINIQSMDQLHPAMLPNFIWSFAPNEPSLPSSCTILNPEGRWESADCQESLPHACASKLSGESGFDWVLGSAAVFSKGSCPEGYAFGRPLIGRSNSVLSQVANGRRVFINHVN